MANLSPLKGIAMCASGERLFVLRDNSCNVVDISFLMGHHLPLRQPATRNLYLPIEVLAVSPKTRTCFIAHSRGTFRFFDVNTNDILVRDSSSSATIQHAAWSHDEQYFGIANDLCQVYIQTKSTVQQFWSTRSQAQIPEPAHQVLFHAINDIIFIASENFLYIWRFNEHAAPSLMVSFSQSCWWLNHPLDCNILLGCEPTGIHVLEWRNLQEKSYISFISLTDPALELHVAVVEECSAQTDNARRLIKALLSPDGSEILFHTSLMDGSYHDVFFLDTAQISRIEKARRLHITVTRCPRAVTQKLTRALGYVRKTPTGKQSQPLKDLIAFVDTTGWFYTFDRDGVLCNYFAFLPSDLMMEENLDLAQFTDDGTFFLPGDGNLRIISNGFDTVFTTTEVM